MTTSNNKTKKVPFFAKKVEGKALVVKTSIKAGAMEHQPK